MKVRQGVQLQEKLTSAIADMEKLEKKMEKAGVESELMTQIQTTVKGVAKKVLTEFFGQTPESAKELAEEANALGEENDD